VYSDEVWMMIREMKEKGMSVTAIAEHLRIDRKTVRKYMNSEKVPRPSHSKRKSKLDPVRPIIKVLIDKYDLSASLSSFIPGHSDVMDSWPSL
jgi:transposase